MLYFGVDMDIMPLIDICKKYIRHEGVVIQEAFIPYIPQNWNTNKNKVLVLAESQNLSSSNDDYIKKLEAMSPEERMQRLGAFSGGNIGIGPWDDGSLKLAVEASLGIKESEVAVSNAVLWSQRGDRNQNKNPDRTLQKDSSALWSELLPILKPVKIICCGKIAEKVIQKTNWHGEIVNLRLPSKTAMSRVSGMFNEVDLLKRYPEVNSIIERNPHWLGSEYRKNKIFFACHAVSIQTKI